MCGCLSRAPLLGTWPATQACALDWELNQQPFSSQAGAQSTELCQPGCIIVFEAIVNGIVFLISLSDSSSLVYKNATDFWTFIFYPAALLNSFNSNSFVLRLSS